MKCLECGCEVDMLTNDHLLQCSGLTLQEYAICHQLPLDLVVHRDQVNVARQLADFPAVANRPSEEARSTLQGLRWAGLVHAHDEFVEVPGEIRRLDLLLWDLEQLADYGFAFRQEYEYTADTHRVKARNHLLSRSRNVRRGRQWASPEPPPLFPDCLAVYVAHQAEWHGGYLFMQFPVASHGEDVRAALLRDHGIRCCILNAADHAGGLLLRTLETVDGEGLLSLLESRLRKMPTAWERFTERTPTVTVSKELVFDAAHFITDHPAKCSNLHGGRYQLHVEVSGRIDPVTGCVVDYGYLKRVVNRLVVERFDHHTLNYAAPELSWRSSTEMLCIHIWECLIDYLPGLSGLRLYETTQSWCDYRGPTLAEHQAAGSAAVLHPFAQTPRSALRQRCVTPGDLALRKVGGHDVS